MNFTLSNDFKDRNIDVSLGIIQADVCVEPSSTELVKQLDGVANSRFGTFNGAAASSDPQIAATRKAYKALGKDPARYRPAAEALTRRILQGKGLYHVNNVVDINNLISVQSGISIGAYKSDAISGDVLFRRAEAEESYCGIGRGELNLEGLPVFSDALGPFGCPTSDSERTMITQSECNIIMILICFGDKKGLPQLLSQTADLLKEFAQGENISIQTV